MLSPRRISTLLASFGMLGLVLLCVATVIDVISRWLLNAPIFGMSDIFEVMVPPIIAAFFPAVIAAKQNITIRYLGAKLPPRAGQSVELFGEVVTFVILCGIAWELVRYAHRLFETGQTSWLLMLPAWPSWALTTVFFVTCLPLQLQVIAATCRDFALGRPVTPDGAAASLPLE